MDAITEVRQTIDQLLAELAADREALQEREAALAQAAEQLSQESAVQAAWQQGAMNERGRITALIDLQMETLGRGGLNAVSLRTLREKLLEVEG